MVRTFTLCCIALLGVVTGFAQQNTRALRVCVSADADALNPITNLSYTAGLVNDLLYPGLVRYCPHSGEVQPVLAKSLPKILDEGRTVMYEIRQEAVWNNGTPVTAGDVIFSAKMMLSPYLVEAGKQGYFSAIQEVRAIDDKTVVFYLDRPHPQALDLTGRLPLIAREAFDPEGRLDSVNFAAIRNPSILPPAQQKLLREISAYAGAWGSMPGSTHPDYFCGPYQIKFWKMNQEICLEKNKKFWGREQRVLPASSFEKIRILVREEDEMREMVFHNEVELVLSASPEQFFDLSGIPVLNEDYSFKTIGGNSYEYMGMNTNEGLFADALTRKAMAHLVPYELLLEKAAFGLGERIASEYPLNFPRYRNQSLDLPDFNLDKAATLLAAAGWADSDGDGILDRAGAKGREKFSFSIMFNENRSERAKVAQVFSEIAANAGIEIVLQPVSWKDYLDNLKNKNFEMYIGGWIMEGEEISYRQIWHTEAKESGANFVGFGDEISDKLIEEFERELDENRRIYLAHQIQASIAQEQPCIFLWSSTRPLMISRQIQHPDLTTFGYGFWLPEWSFQEHQ